MSKAKKVFERNILYFHLQILKFSTLHFVWNVEHFDLKSVTLAFNMISQNPFNGGAVRAAAGLQRRDRSSSVSISAVSHDGISADNRCGFMSCSHTSTHQESAAVSVLALHQEDAALASVATR